LICCGGGTAIGTRFDISFYGNWVWNLKDHIDQFFMGLFHLEYLKNLDRNGGDFQLKQYDASENLPELEDPSEAANVLIAENSDYLLGWGILRRMMRDDVYRSAVLSEMEKKKGVNCDGGKE